MKFKAHERFIKAIAIDPQKKFLLSGDVDGSIIVWDYSQFQQVAVIRNTEKQTQGVTALAFSPDGTILACGITHSNSNARVELRDTNTWELLNVIECEEVSDLAWSPDGSVLAVATDRILLISRTNYVEMNSFKGMDNRNNCVTFSRSGNLLIAGGDFYDSSIGLWDAKTLELVSKIPNDDTVWESEQYPFSPLSFIYVSDEAVMLSDERAGMFEIDFQRNRLELFIKPDRIDYWGKAATSSDKKYIAYEQIDGFEEIPDWIKKSSDQMWARPRRFVGVNVQIKELQTAQIIHKVDGISDQVIVLQFIENNRILVGDVDGFLTIEEF